jgi:DNA-binding beta-propeller fold protein YncE
VRVPAPLDRNDVYAADRPGRLSPVVRGFRPLIYVPNSDSATVDEIDPRTYEVVRHFAVGALPQHVVPSYDLKTLWVTNDLGNTLTPIDPRSGRPGKPVPVVDPYNLYFTPDGRFAVVMAERLKRIDFRDAHTMKLRHTLSVPNCAGVNHADYTADGAYMLVSCEFAGRMIVVDVRRQRVVKTISLRAGAKPQDVKLSPRGGLFYVADMISGGVWKLDARSFRKRGFVATGRGAHGLYPSRDSRRLYVSNRDEGSVSVLTFATGRVERKWRLPGGGSPDMGGVSANGRVLWLSGRYHGVVYAIDTRTGRMKRQVPVGSGPHGLCVYPQPGRYSLGHTGVFR